MNNTINKQIGLVTVTCKRDFELITGLLETVNQYIGAEFCHTIILNDSVDHMPELLSVCNQWPRQNRTIIHCDDVGNFKNDQEVHGQEHDAVRGSRTGGIMNGWSLAQILIFYFAEICQATYYVILTSRTRICGHWDLNQIIQDNKSPAAFCLRWTELSTEFHDYFKISYGVFDLDWQKEILTYIPATNTPYVWKTSYILDLLTYIKEKKCTMFDHIHPYAGLDSACDAYIYSAWLRFKNLTDTTYVEDFFNGLIQETR